MPPVGLLGKWCYMNAIMNLKLHQSIYIWILAYLTQILCLKTTKLRKSDTDELKINYLREQNEYFIIHTSTSAFGLHDTSSQAAKACVKEVLALTVFVKRDFGGLAIDGETSIHRLTRAGSLCWNAFCVSTMTFWNSRLFLSLRSQGLHTWRGRLGSGAILWPHNCSAIFNKALFVGLKMSLRWPRSPTERQSRQDAGSIYCRLETGAL